MPPVTLSHTDLTGRGPAGRAWRTGLVQRCDSYLTDPTTVPWRAMGRRFGWRSSVAVPLADRRGHTRALLSLYAHWPGYFASDACTAMLEQIKQSLESASLSELEERPDLAPAVSGYVDRTSHLKRLADGAVEMLYQPVISLPDGRLTKLEALARLRGEGRLISPAEFLPAFGDDELFELFEQGIAPGAAGGAPVGGPRPRRPGCRSTCRWSPPRTTDTRGSSPPCLEQLRRAGPAGSPSSCWRPGSSTGRAGCTGGRSTRSRSSASGWPRTTSGPGYSSLLRLRRFAFDDVKIDQSLVRGTDASPGAALHFIQPINDIAHSLGLSVVIEGLEDAGLIEVGVQLGVDEGQGYGIARPMPLDDVVGWARGYRLDVDPRHPRTPVGALAAHVAWEHRVHLAGQPRLRVGAGPGVLRPHVVPATATASTRPSRPTRTCTARRSSTAASEAHRADLAGLAALVTGLTESAARLGGWAPVRQVALAMLAGCASSSPGRPATSAPGWSPSCCAGATRWWRRPPSAPRPERFSWGSGRVGAHGRHRRRRGADRPPPGVDAVCYLVHGLSMPDFRARDRLAAQNMRDAVTANGVGRVVYLSGAGARRAGGGAVPAHRLPARGGGDPAARARRRRCRCGPAS